MATDFNQLCLWKRCQMYQIFFYKNQIKLMLKFIKNKFYSRIQNTCGSILIKYFKSFIVCSGIS